MRTRERVATAPRTATLNVEGLPLVFGIYWLIAPRERGASGGVEKWEIGKVVG